MHGLKTILSVFLFLMMIESIGQNAAGVYVGTSPCDKGPRPFIGITTTENCDRIMWELTLSATTFSLNAGHGYHIDNRTFKKTGTKTIAGTWTSTSHKNSKQVIQLVSGNKTIQFLRMDGNILHLLNNDKSLMIGDGGQSYTLSRKK